MARLQPGDNAPLIHATDMKGKSVKLANDRYTLVTFLRYSGCQMCNLALQRLTLEHATLKRNNCDVIAFVQSSPKNIEKNIYHRHKVPPEFSIVADQEGEWYRHYGVQTDLHSLPAMVKNLPSWLKSTQGSSFKSEHIDGNFFLVPALFIIDKRHIVQFCDYEANFYSHETFTPIYELLTFGGVY